jgi:hypothetical protein
LDLRRNKPLVGQLLAYAGATFIDDRAMYPWRFSPRHEPQFDWIMAAGMGPLLYRGTVRRPDLLPLRRRTSLKSADLTAQVIHGNLVDAANEVIDVCAALGVPITLLKGISTSEEFWPIPHTRPMGDIDVLVPAHRYAEVEAAMLRGAYRQPPIEDHDETPYHGPPFQHIRHRVWVEVHTALFRKNSEMLGNTLFSPSAIARETTPSTFHGRKIYRLSHELQLLYIAASWVGDMTTHRINPSFVTALFDAVYLLKAFGRTLSWDRVLELLDNEFAAASLHVLLRFLARHRLITVDRAVLRRVARGQHLVGPLQMVAIQTVLDRHLAGGRYWTLRFPPPVPGRYSARWQWQKRIGRRLRGPAAT